MDAAAVYLQSLARMRQPMLAHNASKAAAIKVQTHVRMLQTVRNFGAKKGLSIKSKQTGWPLCAIGVSSNRNGQWVLSRKISVEK